jgi:hypothetical protein
VAELSGIERIMKTKRLIIILTSAVLVAAYVISIVPNFRRHAEWNRAVNALGSLSLDRVVTAVQAFARDRKAGGSPLPAVVPIGELVTGGYLRADEAAAFSGAEATVSLAAADETASAMELIRMRFPDGFVTVQSTDGSVFSPVESKPDTKGRIETGH